MFSRLWQKPQNDWRSVLAQAHRLADEGQYNEAILLVKRAIDIVQRRAGVNLEEARGFCARIAAGTMHHSNDNTLYQGFAYIAVRMSKDSDIPYAEVCRLMMQAENYAVPYRDDLKRQYGAGFDSNHGFFALYPLVCAWGEISTSKGADTEDAQSRRVFWEEVISQPWRLL